MDTCLEKAPAGAYEPGDQQWLRPPSSGHPGPLPQDKETRGGEGGGADGASHPRLKLASLFTKKLAEEHRPFGCDLNSKCFPFINIVKSS
jgi:hypothetical protein